jgi:hypothetical protein
LFGTSSTVVRCLSSILVISVRFSFSRKEVTSTGTCTCTAAVFSFIDSSWMMRRICSAEDSVSRMWPVPLQRGQVMWLPSDSAGAGAGGSAPAGRTWRSS